MFMEVLHPHPKYLLNDKTNTRIVSFALRSRVAHHWSAHASKV